MCDKLLAMSMPSTPGIDNRRLNGPDKDSNKVLLHKVCHQSLQTRDADPLTTDRIRKNLAFIKKIKKY